MQRRTFLKLGPGAAVGAALQACGDNIVVQHREPHSATTVATWNNTALMALRAARMAPPAGTRALALMHTAMYDAWSAYDGVAVSTCTGTPARRPVPERSAANKARAISYAAHAVLADLLPSEKAAFDARLAALGHAPAGASRDASTPQGVANQAVDALLAHRHADGANQLGDLTASGISYADYTAYVAQNPPLLVAAPTPFNAITAPDRWQPLRFTNAAGALVTQSFIAPHWSKVAPFALQSAAQFRPGPPARFGSQEYIDQVQRIIEVQMALTDEQMVSAEFWAGGLSSITPPDQWSQFAQFVSQRDRHDDDRDVRLFFAMSNAMFDAGIAAWEAKRYYDSVRPITAIRHLKFGQFVWGLGYGGAASNLQTIAGEAWVPYQSAVAPQPAIPEHVSGHSSYSAAAAEALRLFTGSDHFDHEVTMQPRSSQFKPDFPGAAIKLHWATFSGASADAGISRIYGGIHFDNANLGGRSLGQKAGAQAYAKAQAYWEGRA